MAIGADCCGGTIGTSEDTRCLRNTFPLLCVTLDPTVGFPTCAVDVPWVSASARDSGNTSPANRPANGEEADVLVPCQNWIEETAEEADKSNPVWEEVHFSCCAVLTATEALPLS